MPMNERELRGLINEVKVGRLSRRAFVQRMIALGLTAPLAGQMLAYSGVAHAQTEGQETPGEGEITIETGKDTREDTTRLKFGEVRILIISPSEKKTRTDTLPKADTEKKPKKYEHKNLWAGIDLGVAGYLSPQQSFGMQHEHRLFELDYARSRTWNVNFFEKNLKLYRHNAGIVTGLGTTFTRYHFNNRRTMLTANTDSTYVMETGVATRKHFLSAS
jgi:hypothetical protein